MTSLEKTGYLIGGVIVFCAAGALAGCVIGGAWLLAKAIHIVPPVDSGTWPF